MNIKSPTFLILLVIIAVLIAITVLGILLKPSEDVIRIGYKPSPMLHLVYTAKGTDIFKEKGLNVEFIEFGSTHDVEYALISRKIDAGFVEPEHTIHLLDADEGFQLHIAGIITFPYGASLVVRKDLKIRLDDLEGRTVAAESPFCALLKQFRADARKYDVNVSNITFVYMEPTDMLPALEAGKIDAAISKTNFALLAESQGHYTLYQNWEIKEKDDCCALYQDNLEYFFIVRTIDDEKIQGLVDVFSLLDGAGDEERKQSIVEYSGFPEKLLEKYPVSRFVTPENLDEKTRTFLGVWLWN